MADVAAPVNNKPSALKSFIAGGAGGISLVLTGHPLDTIKVRVQAGMFPDGMSAFRETVKHEGYRGLYKGMAAPLAGVTPMYALCFFGYNFGQQMFGVDSAMLKRMDVADIPRVAAAGAVSACFTTPILAPGERIKCFIQANASQTKSSTTSIVKEMYRQGGIRSVTRGFSATLLRDGVGSAFYFGSYEYMKAHLTPEGMSTPVYVTLGAGGLAGMINWLFALPIDTLKSRLQINPEKYPNGIRSVFSELMAKEGAGALFKGIGPVMARAFPANAACFLGYESTMKFLTYVGME